MCQTFQQWICSNLVNAAYRLVESTLCSLTTLLKTGIHSQKPAHRRNCSIMTLKIKINSKFNFLQFIVQTFSYYGQELTGVTYLLREVQRATSECVYLLVPQHMPAWRSICASRGRKCYSGNLTWWVQLREPRITAQKQE